MQEDTTVIAKPDEATRRELFHMLRWSRAQLVAAGVLQVLLAVLVFVYVSSGYHQMQAGSSKVALAYLRIGGWLLFCVIFYVIMLVWMARYIRAGRQLLAHDSLACLPGMFCAMRKAVMFSTIHVVLSVLYYAYTIFDIFAKNLHR